MRNLHVSYVGKGFYFIIPHSPNPSEIQLSMFITATPDLCREAWTSIHNIDINNRATSRIIYSIVPHELLLSAVRRPLFGLSLSVLRSPVSRPTTDLVTRTNLPPQVEHFIASEIISSLHFWRVICYSTILHCLHRGKYANSFEGYFRDKFVS